MLPGSKVLHAELSKVVHSLLVTGGEIVCASDDFPRPPVRDRPGGSSYGASQLVVLGGAGFVAKHVIGRGCHALEALRGVGIVRVGVAVELTCQFAR